MPLKLPLTVLFALAVLARLAIAAPPAADMTITKGHSGNFTTGDTGDTYSLFVTNSGNKSSSGTVTVVDTLPTGLTGTAISGTGWTCTLGNLTCTRSDPLAAGSSYAAIVVTVNVANNAPASVVNTASVSGGGETNTGNDGASDPTTINQKAPDLSIDVFHSGTWTEGDVGKTYNLRVDNSNIYGASTDGTTVTVVDSLPAGLTATAIAGPGWTCVLATLTCTRSDVLANFTTYPWITVTVNVAKNAPTPLTNSATVSGGGDTNPANNSWGDATDIVQKPDLTLTKSHVGIWNLGAVGMTYTLSVSNVGGIATDGSTVTVVDTLPSGLSLTGLAGPGWSCTPATFTCTRADALAAAGTYAPITVTVDVANNAPANLTNTATVSGGGEIDTANDTASDPTKTMQIDLVLAKTHSGNWNPGDTGKTYALTVSNVGAAPTDGSVVTVVDTLPAGLTATAIAGAGWTCMLGSLTCTRNDVLVAGASYAAITVTANVANNATPHVTNTATVAGGGELNTSNDGASDPTTIVQADLTVSKSHSGPPLVQGQASACCYLINVKNTGTGPSSGPVTLVDALPAGLSAKTLNGAGWTCTLATLTCTRSDVLPAGSQYPSIIMIVAVAGDAPPSVTNTATVSGGGEIDTSNDSGSVTNPVGAAGSAPDLTLTSTHSGNFVQRDAADTYTITVTNSGTASTAGTVSVVDNVPAGLTATFISGASWLCNPATVSCTNNNVLGPGASYSPLTLTVGVAANAPANVVNSASVSGGGEIVTSNDTATDSTTIDERIFADGFGP